MQNIGLRCLADDIPMPPVRKRHKPSEQEKQLGKQLDVLRNENEHLRARLAQLEGQRFRGGQAAPIPLPSGVLLEIFGRLNLADFLTCRLVCSQWKKVSDAEVAWRDREVYLKYPTPKPPPKAFVTVDNRGFKGAMLPESLGRLIIDGTLFSQEGIAWASDAVLTAYTDKIPSGINGVWLNDIEASFEVLNGFLSRLPEDLGELTIHISGLEKPRTARLGSLPLKLKRLNLPPGEKSHRLLAALPMLPKGLEELALCDEDGQGSLTDDQMELLAPKIPPGLKKLEIGDQLRLTAAGITALVKHFPMSAEEIDFGYTPLDDIGLSALCLSFGPKVSYLAIWGAKVTLWGLFKAVDAVASEATIDLEEQLCTMYPDLNRAFWRAVKLKQIDLQCACGEHCLPPKFIQYGKRPRD